MTKIKLGFLGCGKQAGKHIASLKRIPDVELVLGDIDKTLAKELGEKNDVSWVVHPEKILEDDDIMAVIICTPTQTHASAIKSALDTNKDVLCEKPLCDSMEEALALKELDKKSDQIVMVGYIYRFVPVFEEGHKIIHQEQVDGKSLVLGKPLSAFFRLGGRGGHQAWKHQKASGGGAINEMLVHMVDLANWYFGPLVKVEVISCDIRYPERYINGEQVRVDAEDHIWMKCLGRNDIEIFCQADLITPAFSQFVEIQGENGSFMGSIQSDMRSFVFLKESRGGYNVGKTELRYGRRNVFDIQMMTFIQAVLRRELPDRNRIDDSIMLMRVLGDIREQMAV
jgi:predicted dehydrogenase